MAEQVVEDAHYFCRRQTLRHRGEVDDIGEQDRGDIQSWSAIGCVEAFSRSAIERGRMFSETSPRTSPGLDEGREGVAPFLGGEHRQEGEHDRTADCDIEGEHRGREQPGDRRRNGRAALRRGIPEVRKTTTYARYQRATDRTSLNTRAPNGARMPHRPTPPDSRNPPSGIIDRVGANRMSTWFTLRSIRKSRVLAKTTIAPSSTAK